MGLGTMIYLIEVASNLKDLILWLWVVEVVLGVILITIISVGMDGGPRVEEEAKKDARKIGKVMVILFCICLPAQVLIPSRETMYAIAVADQVGQLASNPKVKDLAGTGMDYLNEVLKKELSKLKDSSESANSKGDDNGTKNN